MSEVQGSRASTKLDAASRSSTKLQENAASRSSTKQLEGALEAGSEQADEEEHPQATMHQWWIDWKERGETPPPSEDMNSAIGGWQQWEEEHDEPEIKRPALWEEARVKEKLPMDDAFPRSKQWNQWLENAPLNAPEQLGPDVAQWVCFVCKRLNPLESDTCSVCGTKKGYQSSKPNAAKLHDLSKPRKALPEAQKRITDPRVFYKKDAWGRFVYTIEP